jgi:uncharacterized RDD family membrane protein YckC
MSNDDVTPGPGQPEQPGSEPVPGTPQPPQTPGYGTPPPAAPTPPPAYGAPPPAAPGYGTPPPGAPGYGTPPPAAPGYGAPPPGAPGYGAPGYGTPAYNPGAYAAAGVPNLPYITWIVRVGGYLIDAAIVVVPFIIADIISASGRSSTTIVSTGNGVVIQHGTTSGAALLFALLFWILGIALWVWNRCFRAGRTGQSVGKTVCKTKLVSAETGQPIGAGMAFVRDICHILDSLACYVGWLFPLWDRQRQTFADKIIKTYVLPEDFTG